MKLETTQELHTHGIYNYLKKLSKGHLHDTLKNLTILQKNIKEREEEIRSCPLLQLTIIQETHTPITFTHKLGTLLVASTTFLKTNNPPSHIKETKTRTIPTRTKWNEYEMGKWYKRGEIYKREEKRNASDGGGDRRKIERRDGTPWKQINISTSPTLVTTLLKSAMCNSISDHILVALWVYIIWPEAAMKEKKEWQRKCTQTWFVQNFPLISPK